MDKKLSNLAVNLTLLSASFLFCFFMLEMILRLYTMPRVFDPELDLRPDQNIVMKHKLFGVADVTYYSTNNWGMRGDPIPNDWSDKKTVVVLGGSTVQDFFLSDDKTWAAILQRLLREKNPDILVENAGLSGDSTEENLLMMKNVITKIRPKAIILLAGNNDAKNVPGKITPYHITSAERLCDYSRACQLVLDWYRVWSGSAYLMYGNGNGMPSNGYPIKPVSSCSPQLDHETSKAYPESALQAYKANLGSIIDIAKQNNIKVLFLTQPLLFENNEYWSGIRYLSRLNPNLCISAATRAKILEDFNKILLGVCENNGISCFDLAKSIPHDQKYFYDELHFDEAGAGLVAERIFEYMNHDPQWIDFIKNK